MLVVGGATLKSLWESGQVVRALQEERWDYVVLQEQSLQPINNPAELHKYVRLFASEIKKVGAQTVLFLTWARKSQPENQQAITNAYLSIAKEVHAVVAPVGLAWQRMAKKYPNLSLYDEDGSHPNSAGAYLNACVFYVAFYGKPPEGFSTSKEAKLIEQFTWDFLKARKDRY